MGCSWLGGHHPLPEGLFIMKTENEFISSVLEEISDDFVCKREIWGTHFSGKRLRIDAVIKPKEVSLWKNKNILFGVEFKLPSKQESIGNDTKLITQAIDYHCTKWDEYGYLPILVCPGFITAHQGSYIGFNSALVLSHTLGQLNIGELCNNPDYGWLIRYSASHLVWSKKFGVSCGKSWLFKTKFGAK